MKLRLPHKFQTALMAALASVSITTLSSGTLAVATGAALLAGQQAQAYSRNLTSTYTTAGDTIYNGYVFTMGNSGTTNFSGRTYQQVEYNEQGQWVNVGDPIPSSNSDVDTPLGRGRFWTMYCSTSTAAQGIDFGNTLRLSGATSQQKAQTDFTDFTIGGLITDGDMNNASAAAAANSTYWFYRGGSMDINGTRDVNMDINSHVRFSYATSVNMKKGGTWTIHEGKSLTFDNNSRNTATTFKFFEGQALKVQGGGALYLGNSSNNGTYNVEMQTGSSLHVTGQGTTVNVVAAGSGTFTVNGTITVDAGSTLNINQNTTLGRTITNAGNLTVASGKTVTLASDLSVFEHEVAAYIDYQGLSGNNGFTNGVDYTIVKNTGTSNLTSVKLAGASTATNLDANGRIHVGDTEYATYYINEDNTSMDLAQAISRASTGGGNLTTVDVQGTGATITVGSNQSLNTLSIAGGKSATVSGSGTLTLANLSLGTGSTLGLAQNAHVTITSKPTLSERNVTLAEGSVLDLSGLTLNASLFGDIAGSVTGAGTVKLGTADEIAFSGNQTTNLGTNVEIAGGIKFNGHGYDSNGHTLNLGNGTGTVAGVKVNGDLRLESKMYVYVKAGSSLTATGNLIMGHTTPPNPGFLDVNGGTLSVGHIQIWDNATDNSITLANSTVVATQAGNLFTYNGSDNTGNATTVSATDVTLKSTGVDWAWNRGITFGGTLTVDAGSNTITLGAAGADFRVGKAIELTSGTVAFAGNWEIGDIPHSGTTQYTGGATEGDVNGFASLVTSLQLVNMGDSTHIGDTSGAHFTIGGVTATLNETGLAKTSGDVDYATFHVMTGSENVSQGRKDSHNPVYSLAAGAKLVVDEALQGSQLIREGGSTVNATLEIQSGKTYTSDGNVKHVTLTGAGTYELKSGTSDMVDSLASEWTGTVRFSNVQLPGTNLANYVNAGKTSWVEMYGITGGYLYEWNRSDACAVNIKLNNPDDQTPAWIWNQGSGGTNNTITFTGQWAGTGTFKKDAAYHQSFTFKGDISQWTGEFLFASTGSKTTDLTFAENATAVNIAISKDASSNGTLNVNVGDGTNAFTTTFSKAVNANKLEIKDGASATFEKAVTLNGNLSLRGTETAGASVLLKEGATLNSHLDLSNARTSHGTVTVAADKVLDLQGTNFWMSSNSSIVLQENATFKKGTELTVTGLSGAASTISNTNTEDDVYGLGKAGFTLTNVEATVNTDSADVQLHFVNSKLVTDQTITLKNLQSVFSGMDIQGGTTTVGASVASDTTVTLGAVALSNSGTLALAEHVTGTVNGMNVTASGTVTGGKLVMQDVITMGADATLALTSTTVDVSALSSGEAHPEYVEGQHGGSGFSSLTDMVKLVNFSTGGTVNADGATFIMGSNTGKLIQEGDYRGYVSFDNASYNAYYVNVAGQTESLDYAIRTAAGHEETELEAVYLNAGTLNADVDTTVASLHINETADKASGNVSITGAAANFGTVSGKGTLNVDSATTLTADTLSIASGETLTFAGSEHISFGTITNRGTLDIGADTKVATTNAITVGSGETFTTTGAGTLASSSTLTVQGGTATLGSKSEWSAITIGNGSLNINADTTVSGNLNVGDGDTARSGDITVAQGATLTVNKLNTPWGFNSMTINGVFNATEQFSLNTGSHEYQITGKGTINTKELIIHNTTTKAIFSGGLTINIGDNGIKGDQPLELRDVTVGVLGDSNGWSASRAITLGSADSGTTFNIGNGKAVTLSGAISGSGKLVKDGDGTLNLAYVINNNGYTGNIEVKDGTMVVNGTSGNAFHNVYVGSGATVAINETTTPSTSGDCHDFRFRYTLDGGTLTSVGYETSSGKVQNDQITLTNNSTISGTNKFYMLGASYNATSLNLGGYTLTKEGTNTVSLINTDVSTGTIVVNEGTVEFYKDKTHSRVEADIELNGGTITGAYTYKASDSAVIRNLTAKQDVTVDAAIEIGSNVTLATSVDNGKTLTMTGAITGTGNFSLTGTGTLALGNSINTTGDVTVAAGSAITFANGATITANSLGLEAGSTLDFSAYQGAIGSKVNVVTTTNGVTGFGGASIVKPAISVHGLTTDVKQEGNNIVLTFTPEAEGTMHLYILTGQSNSLGSVKGNPAPADLFAHYASGGLLYNGNMHKGGSRYIADPDWKIVDVQPVGEGDGSYAVTGPEYVFEYLMLKNGWFSDTPSKDSLGVIKASLDGGGDEYWVKDGANSNYDVIVDTVKKGYEEAEAMGYANVTIDGLLYLQGESNGHGGELVQTRYTTFLTNLKTDLEEAGIDTTKILFGEHSVLGEPATWGQTDTSVGNEKSASDTHTQLENLAKATEGIDFVYTRDLDKITSGDSLGVHYNGEAQITIGARYAYAFAVQNGKDVSYNLGNDKKGVVRGDNDQVALTDTAAWWGGTAPAAGQVAVWDVSSVSTPSPAVQLQGYGNYIADGATWTVGGIHVADAYKQLVTINGGTISLGADGINLVGGGLTMTSDVSARESQTWQAANGHKLVVNGTTTIGDNAKLTLADGLYLTFGYITGTGSLEIGTVTFDMDLDYMGTMAKASYISSKGEGANGYVNEVNLIDLSAGDGTIFFTHGGGVDDNITQAGGLADCTLTLGEDSKTLKVTMPSTAPKTVYFTRSGEVVYTADDAGKNGIYKATELVLSGQQDSPATLTLSTALKSGVGIKADGLGGTVKIGSNVVLNASSLETDGAPVTIAGSGEYVGKTLGAVGSVSAADVLGQGVTLASDWTGSVVLSGGNSSFSSYTNMGNLADFYKTGSTIVFNGLYGYFDNSYTIGANIEFRGTGVDGTGAALTYTAGNNKTVELSGTVTGKGDFVFDKNGGNPDAIKFTGNIADWNGTITTGNHSTATLNLTFGGAVTDVNVAITKGQNHPINVTVDATNAVSFNKALTGLDNLTLNANKSASVLGGIDTAATTLNGGASLTIGGTDTTNSLGTVTVNGTGSSLTINQAATITGVTLSNNASTTVTNNVAGANLGNVTLNNNTALTIGGTAAVAAGNVKLADTSAASIILDNDFSVSQLDTIGGEKTLSIGSAVGVTKTLTTGALGFDNFNTVIALQNVNMVVTGAATVGELDAHSNNIGTMLVGSGATLNLQGTTQWNTSDNKYVDLVISNGGAVSVTGGTENTLRGVNLGAGSSLTFGTGTTTTIGGAVVLANTITNDGSVTLTGTVNLDALTALTVDDGYDDGEHDGNGFYYNSSTVRVFAEDHVGEVVSTGATITYKGVGGTLNDEGIFKANGEKDMTTFHVRVGETSEDYTTAFGHAGEQLTTVKLADKTAINLNKADAALAHLVLTEDASATVQVSENATIASVEGVGAGQTLAITGTTGKVLTLSANNTMDGTVDVQGGTLKTTAETALGNAHVDVAAAGTLELGANLTLANGLDNAGTISMAGKTLTLNGQDGRSTYNLGTITGNDSTNLIVNANADAVFTGNATMHHVQAAANSTVTVAETATLTLTNTANRAQVANHSAFYALDNRGTISIKGYNGDFHLYGTGDGQVFNLGRLNIDSTSATGTAYILTAGSVNYTTDIVVKSLSGGGANQILQATTCYNGNGTGQVVDLFLGESQDHNNLYEGTIQYGIGTSSAKAGSGMNVVLKDELVASKAVLETTFSGGTSATVTVDTERAQVKGLKDASTGKTVKVSGTEADKNRVLEIVGDDNYTYGGKLGANLDVVHSGSGTQSFGGVDGFDGSIDVEAGTLNIMNIAQAASVSAQDVTINNSNLGVYTNATAAEENVGALTVKGTLTASGENAKLNANLVMDAGSTLDVSVYGGTGGLNMGCSVTLNPGMSLSTKDMENVAGLGFMEAYDLYHDVESFFIGNTQYEAITFASETWVKASEIFDNDALQGKDYYVFYSGVNPGGNGGNVGTIYIVQVPEPTTGTLSLLALCALAARRRRK